MNLLEAYEIYEQDKILEGYSKTNTLKSYRWQNKQLYEYFGADKDIEEITTQELKTYLIEKHSNLKPSSMGHRIRGLRSFFHYLSDEGYVTKNVAAKLKEPKEGFRVPKAFSEEDAERLREACNTPLEHSLIEFLYSTGCRVGELYNLNIRDVNWENRSVLVVGKGNKQREVYISLKAKIWLQWYVDERVDNDSALFVTERAPRRLSTTMIRYVVKRVGKNAGLDIDMYPHLWRHTFATHMLNRGAPLEVVQDQLGHAKIETTKIYCHLSGARRKEAHDRYF